jgi:hypothetical protein
MVSSFFPFVGRAVSLTFFVLQKDDNEFIGSIPDEIGNLNSLELLDLGKKIISFLRSSIHTYTSLISSFVFEFSREQ